MVFPAPPGAGGAPPQGGTGAASAPGAMPGAASHGMEKLKLGLKTLQEALPQLPMGSEIHTAVLKAVADVGKHLEKEGGMGAPPGANIQQLLEMLRSAKQSGAVPPQMPGPAGGAPPPMGGAPPPPPMGA